MYEVLAFVDICGIPKRDGSMKPYYEHAGITIYHGDCREVLPLAVELMLTDPPYGLAERWSGGGTWQHHKGIYAEARRWDQRVEDELLGDLLLCADVSIIWGGHLYTLPVTRCWLAWFKSPLMDTVGDFELAWTSMDKPSKAFDERRNPDGRRQHPTQKPLSLFQWCIQQSETSGVILDPFMGSGTTLRAAKDLGREAIGIEIEERYCEIAAERLAQEVLPL
jgi:DNA modification methylase